MNSVISSSSSLQNSFINTIDHLPCDVIRSLWLIQSCNIHINKSRNKLNILLEELQTLSPNETFHQKELIREMIQLKSTISRYTVESISEVKAMNNQLITHKLVLSDELTELQHIYEARSSQIRDNREVNEGLRKQLIEHYKENPLISQQEALKEREQANKLEAKKKKQAASDSSGLKLLLKIPHKVSKHKLSVKSVSRSNKAKIPKIKKKVQKPIIIEEEEPEEIPVEDEEALKTYCFCNQGSFGEMIACDNEDSCPNGEWFHYKCVGLLNRVEALKYTTGKLKWFCSDHCREIVESKEAAIAERKKKKKRRKW
ncbi:hypothetical protein DFJ63DRAFT_22476 [Scheffersomyces coipomensis]|uniref:uncharacterized protein n=1 Tax=Scheffersomyces coipomensis TaxID=1788519 RepID=UPI00315C7DC1